MPDWNRYVRTNLSLPGLRSDRVNAIIEDLSQQLEEAYQEALVRGASEDEALSEARSHIPDWDAFIDAIYRSERHDKKSGLLIWEEGLHERQYETEGLLARLAEDLIKDATYSVRMVINNPGFAAVTILILALGIGANTAIFSVVNAVLVRPLAYPDPERLVCVWSANEAGESRFGSTSPLDLEDWRNQNQVFEEMSGFPRVRLQGLVLTGGDIPREINVAYVTEGFFETLGMGPHRGRTLLPEDHVEGSNRVVVLSHGAWQLIFGTDPTIVGGTLTLDDMPFEVAGVMPVGFEYPSAEVDIWAPLSLIPESGVPRRRDVRWLEVVARLKTGVPIERARADLITIVRRLAQQYPASNGDLTAVTLQPLQERLVGDVRTSMLVIFTAVGLVLFIACANIASLVLARSEGRSKEFALRSALGAGRWRMVRQVVTENILLSLLGGALGLFLGIWGVSVLIALAPGEIPRISGVRMDWNVLLFAAVLSLFAGLLFGLAPALRASASDDFEALREGKSSSNSTRGRSRVGGLLVAGEVAVVVVLSIAAGLMARSYSRLLNVDPGFNPDHLLTMTVAARTYKYPDRQEYTGFFREVLERVRQIPGVASAGMVRPFPLRGDTFEGEGFSFRLDGRPRGRSSEEAQAVLRFVSPDYFRTMGIPLLSGRDFTERDDRESPFVLVINKAAADRYWPGENPVGQTIRLGSAGVITIIGVVGNVRQLTLSEQPKPAAYTVYTQTTRVGMTLVVRTTEDPLGMINTVQRSVWEVNPDQPIQDVATMNQVISDSLAQRRFSMALLGVFAILALILAAAGIYGVIAFMINHRTHEIGIRTALGAQSSDVLRLIVGHGMLLASIGLGAGLAGSLALSRFLQSLIFGITPTDIMTYVASTAALLATVLLACYVPARRATKVDPVVALRRE